MGSGSQIHHALGHRRCGVARLSQGYSRQDFAFVGRRQHDYLAVLGHAVQPVVDADG